eukprot:gene22993-30181_t
MSALGVKLYRDPAATLGNRSPLTLAAVNKMPLEVVPEIRWCIDSRDSCYAATKGQAKKMGASTSKIEDLDIRPLPIRDNVARQLQPLTSERDTSSNLPSNNQPEKLNQNNHYDNDSSYTGPTCKVVSSPSPSLTPRYNMLQEGISNLSISKPSFGGSALGGEGDLLATSRISIVSHTHGRERRAERGIEKRELQEAVKYGHKERANPGREGSTRWRYTHKGVVYITDESSRHEVTSWRMDDAEDIPHPGLAFAGLEASTHVVVVIDCSGSMRKGDVPGYKSRTQAVYDTVAKDLVEKHLNSKVYSLQLSLIEMSDEAKVVLERVAWDNDLLRFLKRRATSMYARSHGNYLPALDQALELLKGGAASQSSMFLIFLSDGAPSDHNFKSCEHGVQVWQADPNAIKAFNGKPAFNNCNLCGHAVRKKLQDRVISDCVNKMKHLGDLFGRDRMYAATVAFGPPKENYFVLQSMAAALPKQTSSFHKLGLSINLLQTAFTALSSTLTTLATDAGGSRGLTLRKDITSHKERQDFKEEQVLTNGVDWDLYCGVKFMSKTRYNLTTDSMEKVAFTPIKASFVRQLPIVETKEKRKKKMGVAHATCSLANGAERIVYQCTDVVSYNGGQTAYCVGPKLVAKSSIHQEHVYDVEFHRKFCRTQGEAEELAVMFNRRLALGKEWQLHFLACFVYTVRDYRFEQNSGRIDVLVEQELEGKFTKWNNNAGGVAKGMNAPMSQLRANVMGLGAINEDEEEEEEGEESRDEGADDLKLEYIPQCFSHFTHEDTNGHKLVCDIQGVWNAEDGFLLTDPVIHHHSNSRRHGATDRGKPGMEKFFETHRCNPLCHRLGLQIR